MEKYTKHYIGCKFEDYNLNYDVSEIKNRDVCSIISKYGIDEAVFRKQLAGFADSFDVIAFCLYDVHFIINDDIKYSSGKTNIRWIYFGHRVTILDFDSSFQKIRGNKNADFFCKIGNIFYALGPNDAIFDEYIDEYYDELERINLKVLR